MAIRQHKEELADLSVIHCLEKQSIKASNSTIKIQQF